MPSAFPLLDQRPTEDLKLLPGTSQHMYRNPAGVSSSSEPSVFEILRFCLLSRPASDEFLKSEAFGGFPQLVSHIKWARVTLDRIGAWELILPSLDNWGFGILRSRRWALCTSFCACVLFDLSSSVSVSLTDDHIEGLSL